MKKYQLYFNKKIYNFYKNSGEIFTYIFLYRHIFYIIYLKIYITLYFIYFIFILFLYTKYIYQGVTYLLYGILIKFI